MNNIYDILLNFNKEKAYQFYEWNDSDNIIHIKKIPVLKVTDEQMMMVIKNTIKISNDVISKIYNKTEEFSKKKLVNIPYAVIIGNSKECYAFRFNKYGEELGRSNLVLDEKEEVLEIIKQLKLEEISISPLKPITSCDIGTRFEMTNKRHIRNEIQKIYNLDDISKLKYIYYEVFGKCESNKSLMYNNLINEINGDWGEKHEQLFELFKILNVKKQL